MKTKISSRTGSLLILAVLLPAAILAFVLFADTGVKRLETDVISWADAAEKCKEKYKSFYSPGTVKTPNCKKRLEDDTYFYFYWRKPLSILIRKSNGEQITYPGTCQVSRNSGKIVHITLNKKEIGNKQGK